jgi:hypothetical protein
MISEQLTNLLSYVLADHLATEVLNDLRAADKPTEFTAERVARQVIAGGLAPYVEPPSKMINALGESLGKSLLRELVGE